MGAAGADAAFAATGKGSDATGAGTAAAFAALFGADWPRDSAGAGAGAGAGATVGAGSLRSMRSCFSASTRPCAAALDHQKRA